MDTPTLTATEQEHMAKGGRVFIVDEIPGPLWRVLMVKQGTCKVLLKPDGMDGYSDKQYAIDTAHCIADLSEDQPLVRE